MNIKKWSKRKLLNEYNSICQMIDYGSYGCRDLIYREALEIEIERRGFEINCNYSFN